MALNLYCKLPFGSFDRDNAVVKQVAARLGRTSNSLAMKLCNFASLDPVQRARGIAGLAGASREDKAAWEAFHADLAVLGPESEQLLHDLFTGDEEAEVDLLGRDAGRVEPGVPSPVRRTPTPPTGGTDRRATATLRRGQQFFRQSVLNAYGLACCITGVSVPRLLVASHIRPWADFPESRLDLRNGLCLSSLHDAAFDSGLMTLDAERRVVLSSKLRSYFPQPVLEANFARFEGKPIRTTEKVCEPDDAHLAYHREAIFLG